jgi:hypothetical protein
MWCLAAVGISGRIRQSNVRLPLGFLAASPGLWTYAAIRWVHQMEYKTTHSSSLAALQPHRSNGIDSYVIKRPLI